MDRTSLDWAQFFLNGLSAVIKTSRCYDAIFDCLSRVLNVLVTSAVHSYTDLYSSRCFNLSSFLPVSNCCQSQTEQWVQNNVHFYWLYHCPLPFFLFLFFIHYLLLLFLFLSFLLLSLFIIILLHSFESGLISFIASEMLLWSFRNAWAKSVIKVFLLNCLTQLRSQIAAFTSESNDRIYCVSSARSEAQAIFIYENDYIQELILVFYRLYSASLPGSDDFVLFDSLDWNGARSQMFNAIIAILRIS